MPELYLMRHGQTALGARGAFQGQIDEGLDEFGCDQAKTIADVLVSKLPEICGLPIVSSPLRRAYETAEIISAIAFKDTGSIDTELAIQEMSFGSWEGMTTHEVKKLFPTERKRRKNDRWNFVPPGGESYALLAARVGRWWQALEEPVLGVTHSGVIRVAAHVIGEMDQTAAMALEIGHCSIWKLENGNVTNVGGLPSSHEMSLSPK